MQMKNITKNYHKKQYNTYLNGLGKKKASNACLLFFS